MEARLVNQRPALLNLPINLWRGQAGGVGLARKSLHHELASAGPWGPGPASTSVLQAGPETKPRPGTGPGPGRTPVLHSALTPVTDPSWEGCGQVGQSRLSSPGAAAWRFHASPSEGQGIPDGDTHQR